MSLMGAQLWFDIIHLCWKTSDSRWWLGEVFQVRRSCCCGPDSHSQRLWHDLDSTRTVSTENKKKMLPILVESSHFAFLGNFFLRQHRIIKMPWYGVWKLHSIFCWTVTILSNHIPHVLFHSYMAPYITCYVLCCLFLNWAVRSFIDLFFHTAWVLMLYFVRGCMIFFSLFKCDTSSMVD